jgi:hypothetical protein
MQNKGGSVVVTPTSTPVVIPLRAPRLLTGKRSRFRRGSSEGKLALGGEA